MASSHARVGNARPIAHEWRLEADPHENMVHARQRAGDEHLGIVPPAGQGFDRPAPFLTMPGESL
jgi:hypothetical protein